MVHLFFRNLKSSTGKEVPKYFKQNAVQDHAEVVTKNMVLMPCFTTGLAFVNVLLPFIMLRRFVCSSNSNRYADGCTLLAELPMVGTSLDINQTQNIP
jgi:hypothetical protein